MRSDGTEIRKLATAPRAPRFLRWSLTAATGHRFSLRGKQGSFKLTFWEASVESGAVH